jgi:hypothetical protein
MTEFAQWIGAVWRHWKVLATGPLLSLGTGIFEHVKQASISRTWYAVLLLCPFPLAFFFGWRDEYRRAKDAEAERDEAIDRDRPEVFVTLSFGSDGVRLVGVQNCGVRDARNVQIQTLHLIGVKRGRKETKELKFPQISRLAVSSEPEYPLVRLNNFIDLERGADMGIYLRSWCDDWERNSLEFEMSVQWFDSSGNEFGSTSRMIYSREEQTCRTVTGFVRRVSPIG